MPNRWIIRLQGEPKLLGSPLHFPSQLIFCSSFLQTDSTVYHSQQKQSLFVFLLFSISRKHDCPRRNWFNTSEESRAQYIEAMCKLIPLFLSLNQDNSIQWDPKKSICSVSLKPTPLTAPGRDQIVKDKFLQKMDLYRSRLFHFPYLLPVT